jgi:hypothetical protein
LNANRCRLSTLCLPWVDSVEKIENRTTPKISQMSVFGRFRSADCALT